MKMNFKIAGIFAVIGFLGAALYQYSSDKNYTSTVKFSVPQTASSTSAVSLFDSHATANTEKLQSQEYIAKALSNTPSLISKSVDADFQSTPANYSFPFDINYKQIGGKEFEPQSYTIKRIDKNTYQLTASYCGIERVKKGKFSEPLTDNNLSLTIEPRENTYGTTAILTPVEYRFTVYSAASIAKNLSINNQISATEKNGVVVLDITTSNPTLSHIIATNLSNQFIGTETNTSTENNTNGEGNTLEKLSNQIADTEKEIAEYKKKNQLTDIETNGEQNLVFLKSLQLQKSNFEIQLASLDNLSDYLRKNRAINNSLIEFGTITDQGFSDLISRLNQKYNQKEIATVSANNDPEIEAIKTQLSERLINTRKKVAMQINKISEQINIAQKSISKLPEQANTLAALERKMQLDKKVYELMVDKKAAEIAGMVTPVHAFEVIAPATLPSAPSWPSAWYVLTLGTLLGTAIGTIISFIISLVKTPVVKTRTEIDSTSAIPFMATIPENTNSIHNYQPDVNNLCTAILMKPECKVITFASSTTVEGKSLIASKLAQSLAAIDKKVLLLDMNIDNPVLGSFFGIASGETLNEVLQGSSDVHDAICLTTYPNLELLTAGELPAGINTFLSSPLKNQIFNTLKNHYDYIIIDTASSESGIESAAMMKMSDLNLYIVKANSTRKSSLVAIEKIKSDFELSNVYLVLNNYIGTGTASKSNNKTRRIRNINIQRNVSIKHNPVAGALRRIALWFY